MLRALCIGVIAISGILAGCSRVKDLQLFGTWRAEDENAVTEFAFRADHTFTSWDNSKTELSTPNTIVQTGVWRVHGDRLELDYKWANYPQNHEHTTIVIKSGGNDRFLVKPPEAKEPFDLVRVAVPQCGLSLATQSQIATVTAEQIFGTWRIHYNTHDYEQSFSQDHTCSISARLNGVLEQLGRGKWRIDGNRLIMEADRKEGESAEPDFSWTITRVEPQCIAIMDGRVPYALERLQ